MLVFHAHCQLGNQMFIYACARSLARQRGLSYCLSSLDTLEKYFELHTEDRNNKLRYNIFRLTNILPWSGYKFYHLQDNRHDYSSQMRREKSKNVWYYGYFQGKNYLFENSPDIQKAFTIKPEFRDKFLDFRKKHLQGEYIAVHIRLRDYRTFGPDFLDGPDLTLPLNYYRNILLEQKALFPDTPIIFLSDEIETVRQSFSDFPDAIFSEQSPIVDFQILSSAKIAIISHSSFAWWASFLSTERTQKVIVPEYFLGFRVKKEFPVNIIHPDWEKREVTLS